MTARDAGKLMDADAPVRHCFFRSEPEGFRSLCVGERTPMSLMLAGGQGGEVRLKLYLSLIWLGARKPVEGKPAGAWARLFGLSEPNTNGAQRVAAAIDWLVTHRFATAERSRGRPAKLAPRHERGRAEYSRPGVNRSGPEFPAEDRYLKVPQELWSQGWMGVLSGAALASFIILLDEAYRSNAVRTETQRGRTGDQYEKLAGMPSFVWLSESVLVDRYRVSWDLWEKGCRELTALKLTTRRLRGTVIGFGPRHKRRETKLNVKVLLEGPVKPKML